ncbi:FkbM family methyltransferase [Flavobacterium sp. LB1P62]|uniref:FkbM family methyltransferase n=1 Tax=Flavobacterium sp. LB1P62 TaxID=3401715 RepID=UPI003AAA4710
MKKMIYSFISKLGYKIENKKKEKKRKLQFVNQFDAKINQFLLIKSISFIEKILESYPDLKIEDDNNGLVFEFNGVKIYVESYEEILIINEIFVEKDYGFFTNETVVLIDIGTNIGIASVFFSKKNNISKIYAFEPVEATYNQALINFKMNEHFLKVNKFNKYGLAKNDKKEIFLFNNNVKGNTGVRGAMSASFVSSMVVEVEVELRNATTEIEKIIIENPNTKIAVKMDCEGGEYEIFENLEASGCIKKIDFLILEWHDRGSESLELILQKNKFDYFTRNLTCKTGMLYAYKK